MTGLIRNTLLPSLLVFILACSSSEMTNKKGSSLNKEDNDILANLRTSILPKAYADQDTLLLNKLLHNKFQLIDDQGSFFNKKDELNYALSEPSYSSYSFEISKISLFENGTAVIYGTGIMTGNDGESNYVTSYKSSDVFIKENNEWKMINSHVSGVDEQKDDVSE